MGQRAWRISLGLLTIPLLSACGLWGSNNPSHNVESSVSESGPATADPSLGPEANKVLFDRVNRKTIADSQQLPTSKQLVDNLVAAGFTKSQMQVTSNKTTLKMEAYSISVSVKIGGKCLVGQYGQRIGGYTSSITNPLKSTGECLIGDTVPIDW